MERLYWFAQTLQQSPREDIALLGFLLDGLLKQAEEEFQAKTDRESA